MPYLLLIVEARGQRQTRTPDEGKAIYERMLQFGAELERRGMLKGVESFASIPRRRAWRCAPASVRSSMDHFSEAKEMIGGFFLLDCATKDEATVEVRETAPCYQ